MSESFLTLPDLPNWRVRLYSAIALDGSTPIIWYAKLERQKKDGKWVTTVSGFHAYGDAFEAAMGASKALETARKYQRKVRAGIIRPFQDRT